MRNILLLPRRLLVRLISLYQMTLSPDHGPLKDLYAYGYCRHTPTCSQYAKQIVEQRGVIVGGSKTVWRLLHCTPFHSPSEAKILEITKSDETFKK